MRKEVKRKHAVFPVVNLNLSIVTLKYKTVPTVVDSVMTQITNVGYGLI